VVSWYLGVKVVDSHGTAVGSANVTAGNSTAPVVESKLTDANGLTRLTLMQKMINATGSYPVGNYTVTAKYGEYIGQEFVNMTGDQSITISLPFTVPEFPSVLVLPAFIAATLIAVAAFKRKTRLPAV
jgi:carbohydrate-selective porin OprB